MQTLCREPHSQVQPRVTRKRYREASPTERIYIESGTVVVSRSRISGTVSKAQFEAAIAHLEARYGMLRSIVEHGQFIERTDDSCALEAWLPANICPADSVYATLLNAGLDTRKRLYRVDVIADADSLDVFMLSSHAMTDATSLVELHSCLAYICDCLVRGVAPALDTQRFPSPVDAAVSRSLALLPAGSTRNTASFSGAFAQIPMPALHDGQRVRHCLERTTINADDMHRISAAAHAQGCSVHSLLLAAFALAIGDVASEAPRRILMRSSVDMRRRLEPHVSPELVFSSITGHITPIPDLDRSLFYIAKHVFRDIHDGVGNGSLFREYLDYPRSFGSAQQLPVALNISDMQAVSFHWPTERLKVTGFEYACGWPTRFPNVSVSVFNGTLVANTVYVQECVDPALMHAISESAVRRLIAACEALWFLP